MMARPGMAPVPMGGPQVRGPQPSFQYTKTARNPPMQGMPGQAVVAATMPKAAVQIPGQEPLTATMLAAAPPQEQKHMLEDGNSLKSKVEEAVAVLQAHQGKASDKK